MADRNVIETPTAPSEAKTTGTASGSPQMNEAHPFRRLSLVLVVLVLGFSVPLYDLVRFALNSGLYSYIVLIPFISAYLVWIERDRLLRAHRQFPSWEGFATTRKWAVIPLLAGCLALAAYWMGNGSNWLPNDYLALMVSAFLCFVVAACLLFLNRNTLRLIAFPLAFLVFMVPFPQLVERGIETFFQHTSAGAAHAMIRGVGTPVFRDDLQFQVPGFNFVVAEACSGIRSSVVLFITSLLAGRLLLRSPWKRAVLALAVIPLAILRNGFRVFTVAELCVHISPDMVHSWIHRRGGPVFFALSLVPLFALLLLLRNSEFRQKNLKS